jgi:CheW-like protein
MSPGRTAAPAPLIVVLYGERRALAASSVCEVGVLEQLTPVPTAPPAVSGITCLHGEMLPVIDLAAARRPSRAGAPLVVVEVGPEPLRAALVVEEVVVEEGDGAPDARPLDVAQALDELKRRVEGR